MKIAVVAPLAVVVPPRRYGGTERVVHWIVEDLVKLGHDVTLYAAGGSQTSAKLIGCSEKGTWELGLSDEECEQANFAALQRALSNKVPYDIVHVHQDAVSGHTAILKQYPEQPVMWTDHCDLALDPAFLTLRELAKIGVGLTALQKHKAAQVLSQILSSSPTPYLAFLGRISPEKGIVPAVHIAKQAGMELKVAAKIGPHDCRYFKTEVEALFMENKVAFIGQIADHEKSQFLTHAHALLFPIDWNECFGLVMIEAMACGCPVIAYRKGSVPEVIEDSITGYIVDTEAEAVEAVRKVAFLDRSRIRQRFEQRFVSGIMVANYVEAYKQTIATYKSRFNCPGRSTKQHTTTIGGSGSKFKPLAPR